MASKTTGIGGKLATERSIARARRPQRTTALPEGGNGAHGAGASPQGKGALAQGLMARPAVARALGVSERTARRMASDPDCPLGRGRRVNRTLYWSAAQVEAAKGWRAAGADAEIDLRLDLAAFQADAEAERAEAQAALPSGAGPLANVLAAPAPALRADDEVSGEHPAIDPETVKAELKLRLEQRLRTAPVRPRTRTEPLAAPAPATATPAADAAALLWDPELEAMSPRQRRRILMLAADALVRHLGPAVAAAKREIGLAPEEGWSALLDRTRYETMKLAATAALVASLVPARSGALVA